MDKLFLDANIFFSATASNTGGSRAIFSLAEHNKLLAVSSIYALTEARVNIERKLGTNYLLTLYRLISYLQAVEQQSLTTSLEQRYARLIVPKDLPILVAATKQNAHYLITLDKKDFCTTLLQQANLPFTILSPGEYLQSL